MSTRSTDTAPALGPSALRWLSNLFSSTVGAKYLVAITGLLLTGFVLVHMLGNLQVFLGRDAMNKYAQSLKAMGPLLWVARGGLLALFVCHLFLALRLKKKSLDARPVRYQNERTLQATWVSRHMALSGLVILAFLIFHLMHHTFGWIDRVEDTETGGTTNYLELSDPEYKDPAHAGASRHDVYHMFIDGFRNRPIAIAYIICQLLLGMHLAHGIRSVFQTLGMNNVKYNALIGGLGYGLTAAIVAGNVFMPIAVMARIIGGDIP
jgi:succinate dehydrogenase / fumarate reductase cytochrome b subunit